ncbi:helix-turn-helix domain-containing protein [Aurantimonas sp. VKM B-3413]|uniref:helix-turn-helix domain-containing protein n=1 Tax=Aurantimonas sp. VKM B-3413 TaxID=2779401 RepID=UPI001E62613A|nr:helix-turn-helix domain-containing protein [Aurantimonas sp. VKM B-3413]MCB8836326.1 helix-turn-helix domain-containing protein [Aurantimonas sp. VKM B-3413]
MRPDDISDVRALPLFREVRDETFDGLLRASFLQRFPPGLVLIRENERADFLHVVVEGAVEMFASSAGRETTISFARPVSAFILAAVLKDQVYLQSARTLETSRVLMIPASSVREAMTDDAAFMAAVVHDLATAYRSTVKDLKNQKLRTGAERLANWLLRLDSEQHGTGSVEIDVEKRQLAARLGMTPENLSRAFAALKQHGAIVRGMRVEIVDRDALIAFARPDPLVDDERT